MMPFTFTDFNFMVDSFLPFNNDGYGNPYEQWLGQR